MAIGSRTFCGAAITLSAAAVLAALSFFSACAGETPSKPVCTNYKDDAAYVRCMREKTKALNADTAVQEKRAADAARRGAEADRRGEAADKQMQQAQNSTACMEEVGKQIEAAKKAGPLSPAQKVQFKAQIERCDKGLIE